MAENRYHRVKSVLDRRQTDLTVCLDEVHKHHNLSAIVRTADAVGCHHVHAVWPQDQRRLTNNTSGGSKNWVETHMHEHIDQAVATIREQNPGVQLLATNLSDSAVDFREIDYTKPTAIIVGQERLGISDRALEHADQHIVIPMQGMVQSLNVSVAAALILYEAQRQRDVAGLYKRTDMMDPVVKHKLLFEGCHPIIATRCREKGLPYPALDEHGEIVADDTFWDILKFKQKK
ncbi:MULTISPECIES: tRNA (guanosine(18)-2'-O)-methyltransferase TrmH [Pseudoalteromonas]|uniref:tRNA (guanosine(18)-2'-O)-methyltransferase n=1 Tax=Pseudoalteromonas peptidolytica F12-50-A1 TaxID=1315280 RepID=A0A8I0T2H7_9GAMM|nr:MULTISPECIES: tRNA (guanosine(18)-2'-O)-methyltransferase TrmH [Pseudoalteromonas]MBE0345015.1 tRNA (guanosine-2'-O-)-methyltransferase [Pseudoalteromonas peptidolytica F12-50-A1]MDW7550390.1 tRNA (guanosine(18)-2'-O)-methyltransferase TrmH [Pseudoalteromonas peptidolytica]NLR15617.1 tRNA (guanosine(18)-2'-O)-methyltransferase TrmH [Pseudoalteromonas peptidolytica]RRS07181.1 tRNA (guanosine(18)-2'-O)-methyltransferase TrmH [Pseudoalteromonas sp. J010]RXF04153.1 tRNA (guanosine(18)-2'-O)-met